MKTKGGLKIEARKWVAVWYQCPVCKGQSGYPMLTPCQWRWRYRKPEICYHYRCNQAIKEEVAHRWYTTFCIEPGLSFTTIAGTLEKLGPFTICQIVQPNIREFKRWYRRRSAEEAEKTKQYRERQAQIEAEWRAKHPLKPETVDNFDPFFDEF